MNLNSYSDFVHSLYPSKNGTASSYVTALHIIDELFRQRDVFNLNQKPVSEITDPLLIAKIIEFIADEEDKFRANTPSIFASGKPTQSSYPRKRFCTSAIRRLGEYVNLLCATDASRMAASGNFSGSQLSASLQRRFHITDKGTDKEVRAMRRVGQEMFRSILLEIYDSKCCITGIDVPDVLRASHIIPWAENKSTRLNPENGLCLSATYDAAFDRHLISFDEDYKLILSPALKANYTSGAFKTHFRDYEGKQITLPTLYRPSQEYLQSHREKLIT